MTNAITDPATGPDDSARLSEVLTEEGFSHLQSEGFSIDQIKNLTEQGWRWIEKTESERLGFGLVGPDGVKQIPAGLLMPLGEGFTQLRCAEPLPQNRHGKSVKYLTLAGQRPVLPPTSEWLDPYRTDVPDVGPFLTEGAKDGMIATLSGVPMGVLAGVSHVRKALPEGCRWNLLFDSDGWTNPQVFCQLFRGALHTRGKVQILPPIEEQPKAGLCEYFASGQTASDLRILLSKAMSPTDLLFEWPSRLVDHPDEAGRVRCIRMAFALAFTALKSLEQETLLALMRRALGKVMGLSTITRLHSLERARWQRIQRRQAGGNSQLAQLYQRMESRYSQRLKWNQRQLQLEMDGRPLERFGTVQLDVALKLDLDAPMDHLKTVVQELADRYAYDPVRDYLARVERDEMCNSRLETFWEDAAVRYFGNDDPLVAKYLKKWAVSAVRRTLEPGCKVDTALFLKGAQGHGKSTFFQALCEDESWFTDSMDSVDKDGLLTAHRHWIIEWAELETVFKKSDQSFVKAFMSRTRDVVRAPYGEAYVRYDRKFVLVGTTNESEFLPDPTGSRRFWVVEVKQPIPIATVRRERDLFWAAALHAVREQQEAHYLNQIEASAQAAANQVYVPTHPWAERIERYIQQRQLEAVTVSELYLDIQPEIARQDRKGQMVISDILTRLGWKKGERKRVDGVRVYPWYAPAAQPPVDGLTSEPEKQGERTPVGTPQNPVPDSVLPLLSQPSQPFSNVEPDQEKTIEEPPDVFSVPESLRDEKVRTLGQSPENPVPDREIGVPNPRPYPSSEVRPVGTDHPQLPLTVVSRFRIPSEWVDPDNLRAGNGRHQFFRVMKIANGRVTLWQLYEGSQSKPQSVGDQNVVLTPEMAERLVPRGTVLAKASKSADRALEPGLGL